MRHVGGALLGLVALLSAPSSARADLVIIQESNGFPGGGQVEETRQKVFLAPERLRVLDERHGWALYVLRDRSVVREASAVDRTFVEKPFTDYQKIRAQREATREGKVREYQKESAREKDDAKRLELKQAFERMGLREDGQTLARTERFDETKTFQVIVDGKRQDLKAEHVIVRENEGPPIFDLWLVPSLPRPEALYRFYEELGTFSAPVIAEVLKLPGFPVEISATLDDGNNRKTLHSRVHEIRDEKLAAIDYDVPTGFKQVTPQEQNQASIPEAKCEVCGKVIHPGSNDGSYIWRDPYHQSPHPVCGDEHRRELIRRLANK